MRRKTLYVPCRLAEQDANWCNVCVAQLAVITGVRGSLIDRVGKVFCIVSAFVQGADDEGRIRRGVIPVQRLNARVKALISR